MNPSLVRIVTRDFCLKVFWSNTKSQFMEDMNHTIVVIAMPVLLQTCHETNIINLYLVTFRYLTYVRKILALINVSPFSGKNGIAIKSNPQIMLIMKSEENCEQIGFRHKR